MAHQKTLDRSISTWLDVGAVNQIKVGAVPDGAAGIKVRHPAPPAMYRGACPTLAARLAGAGLAGAMLSAAH